MQNKNLEKLLKDRDPNSFALEVTVACSRGMKHGKHEVAELTVVMGALKFFDAKDEEAFDNLAEVKVGKVVVALVPGENYSWEAVVGMFFGKDIKVEIINLVDESVPVSSDQEAASSIAP